MRLRMPREHSLCEKLGWNPTGNKYDNSWIFTTHDGSVYADTKLEDLRFLIDKTMDSLRQGGRDPVLYVDSDMCNLVADLSFLTSRISQRRQYIKMTFDWLSLEISRMGAEECIRYRFVQALHTLLRWIDDGGS